MLQAVKAGTVGSKEAAARLVALLRGSLTGGAAGAAAAAAAGGQGVSKAPPPGFGQGPATASLAPPPGLGAPFINHNDPSVSGPPLGRCVRVWRV